MKEEEFDLSKKILPCRCYVDCDDKLLKEEDVKEFNVFLSDMLLLTLGISLIVLGVRGIDLGNLAHWKYWSVITIGTFFCIVSVIKEEKQK